MPTRTLLVLCTIVAVAAAIFMWSRSQFSDPVGAEAANTPEAARQQAQPELAAPAASP